MCIRDSVCAYTNHTILAEALEKWPIHYLEDIVPQLVPIIRKLDEKVKAKYPAENLAIIDSNNLVHMAHMDIHYGFSINGVAALHTEILKNSELHQLDVYKRQSLHRIHQLHSAIVQLVCIADHFCVEKSSFVLNSFQPEITVSGNCHANELIIASVFYESADHRIFSLK